MEGTTSELPLIGIITNRNYQLSELPLINVGNSNVGNSDVFDRNFHFLIFSYRYYLGITTDRNYHSLELPTFGITTH